MSTFVAIPVRNHLADYTRPLVEHLLTHEPSVDGVLIFDNGSTDGTWEWAVALDRVMAFDVPDDSLAQIWNRAIRFAALGECDNVVIANNDIQLAPGSIAALTDALRSEPGLWAVSPNPERRVAQGLDQLGQRTVHGSYRHGGLIGWCFALAAEHWRDVAEPVDEQYEWWYGDCDLFAEIEKRGGRLARVLGVPCDHIGEGTARDGSNEWVHEAKVRDAERFKAKWGHM